MCMYIMLINNCCFSYYMESHAASKLSCAEESYSSSTVGTCTGSVLPNIKQSIFSSIVGTDCIIDDVPKSTYTNRSLGSCIIYSQSCQVMIEAKVAQSAHEECQYTRYWQAYIAFELGWYHAKVSDKHSNIMDTATLERYNLCRKIPCSHELCFQCKLLLSYF